MTPTFRPLDPGHMTRAEALLRAAFGPYVRRLGREQGPEAYSWLPAAVGDGRVYGGFDGGHLVGVVITEPNESGWTLDQIVVDPARQGDGIGSWLLGQVEAKARAAGAPALFLDTAAMMTDLLRLYARHGFEEIRRGPPTHGRDPHLRVYMQKRL